jgi:hypothetical protein
MIGVLAMILVILVILMPAWRRFLGWDVILFFAHFMVLVIVAHFNSFLMCNYNIHWKIVISQQIPLQSNFAGMCIGNLAYIFLSGTVSIIKNTKKRVGQRQALACEQIGSMSCGPPTRGGRSRAQSLQVGGRAIWVIFSHARCVISLAYRT